MSPDHLRAKVIAEWRGLQEPPPERDRCLQVADILEKLIPKLGLKERLGEEQVRDAWKEIVGEFISSNASPAGLSSGVLGIQVLQPSLRYELERNWKGEILQKLQARFGKKAIREVRFRIS